MALLDWAGFDPMTTRGMQLQGLLGGLTGLGAGLMQAGAPRPLGQPGPTMADAFGAFGQGRQQALQGAYQQQQIGREQQRGALWAEAQSDRPDDQISAPARALRGTIKALPEGVRGLVPTMDPGQISGLAVQQATGRVRPMSATELQQAGMPAGTVAYVNDFTGAPNVLRQSQLMDPAEMQQRLRLIAAGRAPQTTWRDERDESGRLIGQRSSTGQFVPLTRGEGFTLGPDQARFDPSGKPIAVGPAARPNLPSGMRIGEDGRAELIPGVADAEQQKATADPTKIAEQEKGLRGEVNKLTENFRTVQDAYNKILKAGPTGQGDLSLLYGYMKLLDPESVVRESEFATAARTGSLPEQIQGFATKVLNGERLPESVRAGFIKEAQNVFSAQSTSYAQNQKLYRELAGRLKLRPENVVLPFETGAPAGAAGAAGAAGSAIDPLGILPRR